MALIHHYALCFMVCVLWSNNRAYFLVKLNYFAAHIDKKSQKFLDAGGWKNPTNHKK